MTNVEADLHSEQAAADSYLHLSHPSGKQERLPATPSCATILLYLKVQSKKLAVIARVPEVEVGSLRMAKEAVHSVTARETNGPV